jgi:hypothetical protein
VEGGSEKRKILFGEGQTVAIVTAIVAYDAPRILISQPTIDHRLLEFGLVQLRENKAMVGATFTEDRLKVGDLDDMAHIWVCPAQQDSADFYAALRPRFKSAQHFASEALDNVLVEMDTSSRAGENPNVESRTLRGLCGSGWCSRHE